MLLTLPPTFRNLLNEMQSIVFMSYRDDDDGLYYFQFCEGKYAREYGLQTHRVSRISLNQLFQPHTYKCIEQHFDKLMSHGGDVVFEMQYNSRWFQVNASRIRGNSGAEGHIVGSAIEISVMKKAEEELRGALDHEKQLNALRTRFINTVSHEFRTPLSGIVLNVELIDRYLNSIDTEARSKAVAQIRIRVAELRALMDGLLSHSAAESLIAFFAPQRVDFERTVAEIIRDFEATLTEHSHVIRFSAAPDLPDVNCDPRLIRHIIRNLLTNATKYSPQHAEVRVTINAHSQQVHLAVRDFGMGISQEDQEQLFKPFFRSREVESISGTGLGLSIVKEFVELHGGSISVLSAPGEGSTFIVILPSINDELPGDSSLRRNGINRGMSHERTPQDLH